jgi:Uncharacterised nucleotidyltransferase
MTNNFTFDNFSPEMQVLIRASEASFVPEKKAEVTHLLQNKSIDWDKLYKLSCFHQVRPVLLRGVLGLPSGLVPTSFLETLKNACFQITTHALRQSQEMLRLLALFKQNNILAIPYKGAAYSNMYYGNLGMREFSDIDLFIHEKDLFEIKKCLLFEGYRPVYNITDTQMAAYIKVSCDYTFDYFSSDNKRLFHVEPHYRSNTLLGNFNYFTLSDCDNTIREVSFSNTTIPALSIENNFLLTVMHHGEGEGWSRLKYLCDIYAFLKKEEKNLDWNFIIEKVEKLQITTQLLVGLAMIQAMYDLALPASITHRLNNLKINNLVQNRYQNLNRDNYSFENVLLFKLKCADGWIDKIKILLSKIFTTTLVDMQVVNLPRQLFFLYMFIRPFRLLLMKKHYKTIFFLRREYFNI